MKVLLTGATGFIGSRLAGHLGASGHSIIAVTRRPGSTADLRGVQVIRECSWSDKELPRAVYDTDAVIHLAGENLFDKRWTKKRKAAMWSSRVETTQRLAAIVAARKPACFLASSAIGWYGASETAVIDERYRRGEGFLAELCEAWEDATKEAEKAGVRTCRVRTGIVLGREGGALAKMLPLFRVGLGGPLGDGKQWWSWIHVRDLCRLFVFLLENPRTSGVYNATAPNPVTMKDVATTLGHVLHRPSVLPAPRAMLRAALGEVAEVLTTGQRVLPRRIVEAGFRFEYPELEGALRDLLGAKEETRT